MHSSSRQSRLYRRFAKLGLCGFAILGLLGCDEPEIKKYTAAREKIVPDNTRLASYDLPKDWIRMAQPVELSVASFQIGDGKKPIVVTVSRFPGEAGGLEANIERWRGKVGLPKLEKQPVEKELRYLNVDGQKTPYVDLSNPAKADADRILGVVAKHGPVTWFFKMQGSPGEVETQKAAFEKFVESVRFGGTGANDG